MLNAGYGVSHLSLNPGNLEKTEFLRIGEKRHQNRTRELGDPVLALLPHFLSSVFSSVNWVEVGIESFNHSTNLTSTRSVLGPALVSGITTVSKTKTLLSGARILSSNI